jgi:F-type H+-transporting ATPase subunit delta
LANDTLQAKRYSQAAFEIALEKKELGKWKIDLQILAALAKDREFVSAIENPMFSLENKLKLLESQTKGINTYVSNLARILTGKGKFNLLTEIYSEYLLMLDSIRGVEKAEVVSAIQLDEKDLIKLAEQLGKISGKKVTLTLRVDPQIIGGMILRIGGKILDGSTRSQLAALRNHLIGYSI